MWDLLGHRKPRAEQPVKSPTDDDSSWRDRWTPSELADQLSKLQLRCAYRGDYEGASVCGDAVAALHELDVADLPG